MFAIHTKRKAIAFRKFKNSFQSRFRNRIEWREREANAGGGD
jgi:hypothetical protein